MFKKRESKAINNTEKNKQPEPRHPAANSLVSFIWVLAVVGVFIGLQVFRVSFEVDRHALILQHLAGKDQVFVFLGDVLDPTGPVNAPHGDKSERLLADAQVPLQHLASAAGAHGFHPVQIVRVQEGLCGSVALPQTLDVPLPLVRIQRVGRPEGEVASDERLEAVVPFGVLAGSIVRGRCGLSHQETGGKRKKDSGSSHFLKGGNKLCSFHSLKHFEITSLFQTVCDRNR